MTSPDRLTLSEPLDDTDVPVAEVVATTRRAEARSVMATVAALLDHDVPVRDVVVVVRDLDEYEAPLHRAAIQYGLAPVFWTQLRVTRTRPYALVESVCEALEFEAIDRETLCRPLEHRWCPPSMTSANTANTGTAAWPLDPNTVQTAIRALPRGPRPLAEWREEFQRTTAIDDRFVTFLEWLMERPAPTPESVSNVLADVVETYEEFAIPVTKAIDSPALIETERDARAVVRMKTLVEQLPHKYADRLDEGTMDRSWNDVAELCQLIATQRPGRREHSNARAVDVLEANDIWLLDVPYVIAVGLIDGEWPQRTESVVPPELQETILAGDGPTGILAPRTAWTDGRDRDQFDDTVRAAGNGLIVTRHTERSDGEERRPSQLLDDIEVDPVLDEERRRLVGPDRELPDAMDTMLDGTEAIDDG
ncbi:hypothetical protein ACERIT_06235 [Halopenitus sp. H-Gu1]|uniref:hypothetical protein n=1 Tax=Halopenitus sp. H-Gu1 TaxID=3242697 RepID=UPI00359DE2B2